MSFLSKNAFVAGDMPFLNRFEGGMLYTCGLDNAGRRDGYVMHGSLHLKTALIVRAECNDEEIIVEGIVRDSALFGQNLVLRRTYRTKIGSGTVELVDVIVNEAYVDGEYCLLYHTNVGYPMLDEGAKVCFDADMVHPCDEWSEKNLFRLHEVSEPTAGEPETCYYMDLKTPCVRVVNEKLGKQFTVCYSADTLPQFLLWKSFACGDYALGIEPCTSRIGGALEMKKIGAQEKKVHRLTISVENM